MVKKLAVLTGGGDCPGLNAVIRAIVRTAYQHGMEVEGIRDGFKGTVEGDFIPLSIGDISGILPRGGTILGTTNRDNPFAYHTVENGEMTTSDRSGQVLDHLHSREIDALLAIGGDGSLHIALEFSRLGYPVIGIPKTIDNDLMATDQTFGFQTAVSTAQEALDRLHTTAESHHRVMILEVMGRYAGWIALYAGIAGGADGILIPEIPYSLDKVAEALTRRKELGKKFSIIVVAEGAVPLNGEMTVAKTVADSPDPIRLGGVGAKLGEEIEAFTGLETRVTVLGHLQRGGSPVAYDRVLGTRYGVAAVEAVMRGDFGSMVALQGGGIVTVPLADAVQKLKKVPLNDSLLSVARNLGIALGD